MPYPDKPQPADPKGPGRMTMPTKAVLQQFLNDPTREMYISQISEVAGLGPGSTHPILARLERCGWLESRWEDVDPHEERRPRRRYFRITPDGVVYAVRELQRADARIHGPRAATRGLPAVDGGL